MKYLLFLIPLFILSGCTLFNNQKERIELNKHFSFNGSLKPEIEITPFRPNQTYVLNSTDCSSNEIVSDNFVVVVDTLITEVTFDGLKTSLKKELLPFGEKNKLDTADFCIETIDGKTYLYPGKAFKGIFSKQETIEKAEKLVEAINETNESKILQNYQKNLKTW